MERKKIINNLKSDGAWYRCNGIIFAAKQGLDDKEVAKLLLGLKDDPVWLFGRQIGWYAIAALDMLGIEKYTGNDRDIKELVDAFPAFASTLEEYSES